MRGKPELLDCNVNFSSQHASKCTIPLGASLGRTGQLNIRWKWRWKWRRLYVCSFDSAENIGLMSLSKEQKVLIEREREEVAWYYSVCTIRGVCEQVDIERPLRIQEWEESKLTSVLQLRPIFLSHSFVSHDSHNPTIHTINELENETKQAAFSKNKSHLFWWRHYSKTRPSKTRKSILTI